MKLPILAATTILVLAALPAQAQRGAERITCYRERNVISCPGYGDFNIRGNNNRWDNDNYDRPSNNRRYDDNNYGRRSSRYDDTNGLWTINQIYISVLGRRTDLDGARTYIQALNNGWTLDRIRRDIAYSPEAQSVINQAYIDILRRNADSGGIETYRNLLASGRSIADVRRELARSPEARTRY
jgi:hypothetical protein